MSSISPSLITVITGLREGRCLTNDVTIAANIILFNANTYQYTVVNTAPARAFGDTITSTRLQMLTLANKLWLRGPIGFTQILGQVRGHIGEAIELKATSNFLSNTSFNDFGSNVTSISSLATQGLDVLVGNVVSAAGAVRAMGPCFDMADIKTFGSPVGLVKKLRQVKLANTIGLTSALANANVDTDNLEDPVYASSISIVLRSITSTSVISTVADQFEIPFTITGSNTNNTQIVFTNSGKTVDNLLDFTDITKLANASVISNLRVSMTSLATKLNDMGASFSSAAEVANLLLGLNTPTLTNLNAFGSNLTSMMSGLSANITAAIGSGRGPLGVPNVTDFTHVITNGPELANCRSNTTVTAANITALSTAITNSTSLFSKAGIDLDNQPSTFGYSTYKSAALALVDIGADTSGSGANIALANIVAKDKYGEAVTSAMAEGKNQALMKNSGIQPPKFG